WLVRFAREGKRKPETPARAAQRPAIALPRRATPDETYRRSGSHSPYARAALEREIAALAACPQGSRNTALNTASFNLHQLVAGGELARWEVHAALVNACVSNGLWTDPADGERKCLATIRSGEEAGLQQPRNRWGRR